MKTSSFHPPQRILMGPGPSDVHPRILEAMGRPTIGHLDPEFVTFMDELKALLKATFCTQNALTMPVSAPGSAGMETCLVNLVEPGDQVVVCVNGVFGTRMAEIVRRIGATPILLETSWGLAVDPDQLNDCLKKHPDSRHVAFVHAETSTGVLSPAKELLEVIHHHDCLGIVDAVTSLGGVPVLVDQWGADAIYSGSQKCLSCTPGLSPISFGPRATEALRSRRHKVPSWFLDLNLVMGYWGQGKRAYHHTAPINALYGLHESLVILHQEGLEACWQRHKTQHTALKAGLVAMGLSFLVDDQQQIPQLNAVKVPEGIDEARVRHELLMDYGIEIGAGLGPLAGSIWRIGLMGHSARPRNVFQFMSALEDCLLRQKTPIERGVALKAAKRVLDQADKTLS